MATKLTKEFAEFVRERGFLIANKGEVSQRTGEDCKLVRRIAANGGNGGNHDTNLDTNDTNYDTNDTNAGTNLGKRILALMLGDSKATVDQLAQICKVSRPTVNRAIKILKATGRIRREGGTRGRWVVLPA